MKIRTSELKLFQAKRLFVFQGLTQSETAFKVGITEKTLGNWIRENNWKVEQTAFLAERAKVGMTVSNSVILEDLKAYIADESPFLSKRIKPIIDNYITLINNQL